MCAESRKSTALRKPPMYPGVRPQARASTHSKKTALEYPVARATNTCATDCSNPKTVWPRIVKTVASVADILRPLRGSRLGAALAGACISFDLLRPEQPCDIRVQGTTNSAVGRPEDLARSLSHRAWRQWSDPVRSEPRDCAVRNGRCLH